MVQFDDTHDKIEVENLVVEVCLGHWLHGSSVGSWYPLREPGQDVFFIDRASCRCSIRDYENGGVLTVQEL